MNLKFYKLLKHLPETTVDASDVMPLVFKPSGEQIKNLPKFEGGILASPWPKFSIEVDGRPLTSTHPNEPDVRVHCIYCEEIQPGNYRLFYYASHFYGGIERHLVVPTTANADLQSDTLSIVANYLKRLHSEKMGIVKGTGHQKYKSNGRKYDYRPSEVVYVSGSPTTPAYTATRKGNHINWASGWQVRAHWRRLENPETLGKDRQGNRTIAGYTWIDAHRKGDQDIAIKPRVVG